MSNEKPHTDEARERVQRNHVSAGASAKRYLPTCSALSRQVGAIKLSDCLFPPHAQPCNLFLYLAARHVTFVSQLYSIVLFVFFCKKIRVFLHSSLFFFSYP
jgi:hypothetical protein